MDSRAPVLASATVRIAPDMNPVTESMGRFAGMLREVADVVERYCAAEDTGAPKLGLAPCNCEACFDGVRHASDCSVHNMPAFPNGPCDCGVITPA